MAGENSTVPTDERRPQCADDDSLGHVTFTRNRCGIYLDEDDRLRSDADVDPFLRSVAPRELTA